MIFEVGVGLLCVLLFGSVFMPVYANDGRSPITNCLSNLKQVATGTLIYAADNDDFLPPYYTFDTAGTGRYLDSLWVYTKNKQIFLCGEDEMHLKETLTANAEGIPGKMSYVHSLALKGFIPNFAKGERLLRLGELENQALTPMLRDPIRGHSNSQFLSPHQSRFNVSYADGHVHGHSPIDEFTQL